MSQQDNTSATLHQMALQAAFDATIQHLESTKTYDFSLRHPREAYLRGVDVYLRLLVDDLEQSMASEEENHAFIDQNLAARIREGDYFPFFVKGKFLLAHLATASFATPTRTTSSHPRDPRSSYETVHEYGHRGY